MEGYKAGILEKYKSERVQKHKSENGVLNGGDEVSYSVLEADFAVEIGLPIDDQETGILLPTALGEFFAETGRNGGRAVRLGGDIILQRIFLCAL